MVADGHIWKFSLFRVGVIAKNTFTQLVRLKVFYFLIIFTILLLAAGFLFMRFSEIQKLKLIKDVSFGAISIFSWIFGISATSMLLPKDIEDRTLYTILSKPISRSEYLLGKFLGVMSLISSIVLIMTVISFGAIYLKKKNIVNDLKESLEKKNIPKEEIVVATKIYDNQGVSYQLAGISLAIILKSSVIVMITLMISAFSSSFLFTLLISFIIFFIGHFQTMLRDYWTGSDIMPIGISKLLSLLIVILFPNLSRYDIGDKVISGINFNIISYFNIFGFALIYISFYYLISCLVFSKREL